MSYIIYLSLIFIIGKMPFYIKFNILPGCSESYIEVIILFFLLFFIFLQELYLIEKHIFIAILGSSLIISTLRNLLLYNIVKNTLFTIILSY
jgi:hypothetical protein